MPSARSRRPHLVILGAGCAGLALARRLEVRGFAGRVTLLEARTAEAVAASGQRWCFWGPPPDRVLEGALSAEWPRWQVSLGDRRAERGAAPWSYRQIRARDYDRVLRARIEAQGWAVEHGVRVASWAKAGDSSVVLSDRGPWTADAVIDARGPGWAEPARAGCPAAVQSFVGWEVETEAAVFDPGLATLMDFQGCAGDRVHFTYLLPYSDRRALLEFTEIAPAGGASPLAALEELLSAWVRPRWPQFRLCEREAGVLPLRVSARRRPGALGAAGGALRASSGYGFLASWEQADRMASAFCGHPEQTAARPSLLSWLDEVLLRVLEDRAGILPEAFYRLFRRVPTAALARFLNGTPQAIDLARVVAAMPLQACLRAAFGRRGEGASLGKPEGVAPAV